MRAQCRSIRQMTQYTEESRFVLETISFAGVLFSACNWLSMALAYLSGGKKKKLVFMVSRWTRSNQSTEKDNTNPSVNMRTL